MKNPKLIENNRVKLAEILKNNALNHEYLSIATGYWDMAGTMQIIDEISNYKNIRLLIGQEPFTFNSKIKNMEDINLYNESFPEAEIISDLEANSKEEELHRFRNTAKKVVELIENNQLEVRIMRKPRLHAKAYIFGDSEDSNAVGIVGSSNFTYAGLTSSAELNSLEDQPPMVVYKPSNANMPHTHLSWFNELWENEDVEEWTGEFKEIIENSPIGDKTFGPYDVYIKTLMEIFPDEMLPPQPLHEDLQDVLYAFQNRNAGILINKLEKMGLAILSDSVGLGKTITGGAVAKHYIEKGKTNIQIIAPAALKQQWIDDLSSVLGLEYREGAFNIVSQQDFNAIDDIYDYYDKEWRRTKKIDLIIIDEAHNLRSKQGRRHDSILKLLMQHEDAHILLLTATPINNSLLDIANQIQLASKGKLSSVNVPYVRPSDKQIEMIDFFEALKRIQTAMKKAYKNNDSFDFEVIKPTIHTGLRHYLVRSTRQGVEAEGSMVDRAGNKKTFPKSNVQSIEYSFKEESVKYTFNCIKKHISDTFENLNPLKLNLGLISQFTQQSLHPIDIYKESVVDMERTFKRFEISKKGQTLGNVFELNESQNLIENILKIIFMLGFTPYRPEVYKHKYYGKTIEEIRNLKTDFKLRIQLTIHNILQITWLKRLESSMFALSSSVTNYVKRINLFQKYLDLGYIVSLSDASLLEDDYNDGEDLEKAFDDYDEYLREREALLDSGKDDSELKKQGVEKVQANPTIYDVQQLQKDLNREKQILKFLEKMLTELSSIKHNTKMIELAKLIKDQEVKNKYGKKILVFSFFADTINYLKKNLSTLLEDSIPDFENKTEYVTGGTSKTEEIVRCFSPKSKKYRIKENETEYNYLFATDVLSEGQNIQDSGILINYDLHWNPVRMIQRNGRINRLGSEFDEVLIGNMKPTQELEMYLKLVNRLETKINTIKNTIGLDQGVLDSSDVNPIEFIEKYYDTGELPETDDDLLAHTDNHILELRKFLGKHKGNSEHIEYVKSIPLGKWNYLPEDIEHKKYLLALMRTKGITAQTNKEIEDNYFIEIESRDEYLAAYIDYNKALDIIRTNENDNKRDFDKINLDRKKVLSRASAEAKRQAENPEDKFDLKPKMLEALIILKQYFNKGIDLQGIIENGVNDILLKKALEKIFRKVNKETKENGSPGVSTINRFTALFNEIQEAQNESKVIKNSEGVLFYASRK